MKNKKLKKIAQIIAHELQHARLKNEVEDIHLNWTEYDPHISEKFKIMYFNLLEYSNDVRIETTSQRINLSTDDITSLKKVKKSNLLNREEDYLRLEVIKDEGFVINRGYKNSCYYSDVNIFNELFDKTNEYKRKVNIKNFDEVFDEIMVQSGMVRDNNLNELFNN